MLTLKVGVPSDYVLDVPAKPAGIIALCSRYIAHEEELPLSEQLALPALDHVKATFAVVKTGHDQAQTSEMIRAASSTALHNAVTTAIPLLKEAIAQLEWKYRANLAMLEHWGLPTKIGARSQVLVEKPAYEGQWDQFLQTYVAHEQSLPPADRLTTPDLAKLAQLATEAHSQRTARDTSASTRQIGIESRTTTADYLMDLLQLACGLLVVTRFEGRVTPALEAWGFTVVAAKSVAKPVAKPNGETPVAV